jgi:hypothetical protein
MRWCGRCGRSSTPGLPASRSRYSSCSSRTPDSGRGACTSVRSAARRSWGTSARDEPPGFLGPARGACARIRPPRRLCAWRTLMPRGAYAVIPSVARDPELDWPCSRTSLGSLVAMLLGMTALTAPNDAVGRWRRSASGASYFGAGVGAAGVCWGGSPIFKASPAGVRRASIGVVSGVGGAGAGVACSAACPFAWGLGRQAAADRAAKNARPRPADRTSFMIFPLRSRADSTGQALESAGLARHFLSVGGKTAARV